MGTATQQIDTHIEKAREALGANLDELDQKVRTATDWRQQFRTRPKTLLGLTFGGGFLLAAVLGGPNKSAAESSRRNDVARQTWGSVRGVLIGMAAARLLKYAAKVLAGPARKA